MQNDITNMKNNGVDATDPRLVEARAKLNEAKGEKQRIRDAESEELAKANSALTKSTYIGSSIANGVLDIGQDVIDFQLNNIGARYHDTARQNRVKNLTGAAGTVVGIAGDVAQGAQFGGWVGALAVLAADLAKQAVDMVQNSMLYTDKQAVNSITEARASERLGLMATDHNRRG